MTESPGGTGGTPLARELYSVALEEGGESGVEKAGRFVTGVLTSAFGGSGYAVVGVAVVVRRREDEEEVLRIDVPDAVSGDAVLGAMQEDLDTYPADEFVDDWLQKAQDGSHIATAEDRARVAGDRDTVAGDRDAEASGLDQRGPEVQ